VSAAERAARAVRGRALVPGRARGRALVLPEPLSLWGGVDPATGVVVDRRHPRAGESLRGRVVLMPAGRGSSSSSSVLAEAVRAGTAPAALLLLEPDPILVVGAIVAHELYGRSVPVACLDRAAFEALPEGTELQVEAGEEEATVRLLA
jgi:predicted aconitase with swiveling domain